MKLFQILLASVLVALQLHSVVSAEDDKCAKTNLYKCPSITCNATIYVTDCLDCDGFLSTDTQSETCFDRKLLSSDNPPSGYLWRDIVGLIVWFCAAGVATACGVGGGGIYVPVGILLLAFSPKPSSGLSQASIFGASLGGLLLNLRNKHPYTTKYEKDGNTVESLEMDAPDNTDQVTYYSRPLIDFDMALFLAPMEMAGAVLGVIVQKLLPNWLYLTLAAIILGFTAYKTYKKFWDARRKEQAKREADAAKQNQPQDDESSSSAEQPSMGETADDPEEHETTEYSKQAPQQDEVAADNDPPVDQAEMIATRQKLLELDARQFPTEKIFGLGVLWFGLIALTFLKGGKGVDSVIGITCASPWYGVLIGTQFLWTLGIALIFGWRLTKQTAEKKRVNYPFHPQDVLWDFEKTKFYAFFTFVAGVVAGLIGIGGGMVLGPLMLVMGIHPRVSSATTATMVVLTSSSVAVLFVTAGMVPWQYAVTFFSTCFVGAFLGKKYIDGYVKKTGKASILIFMLASIIAFATIGCIVTVFLRLSSSNWCLEGFKKFCNLKEEDSDEDMCMINQVLGL